MDMADILHYYEMSLIDKHFMGTTTRKRNRNLVYPGRLLGFGNKYPF